MATANFEKVKTSSIFVFEDIWDNNGSEDFLNCKSFLEDDIKETFKTYKDKEQRLFIAYEYQYYGIKWFIYLTPIYKVSQSDDYYIDVIIELDSDITGNYYNNVIECVEDTIYYSTKNKGILTASAKNLVKKLDIELKTFLSKLEDVFKEHCTELRVIGSFSNGEQLYEKVIKNS